MRPATSPHVPHPAGPTTTVLRAPAWGAAGRHVAVPTDATPPAARARARAGRPLLAAFALAAVAGAAAPGWSPYVVRAGDTLWALAQRHHTTVAHLEAHNHLRTDQLTIGQHLDVPGNGRPSTAGATHRRSVTTPRHYVVRSGDTASGIARRAGTTLATLARLNHLHGTMTIYVGQRLTLPGTTTTVTVPARNSGYAAAIAHSAAVLAGRWSPSTATVRQMVRDEARRQGLDPVLALAVADQESGFHQREVSVTNAIGVMQLEPSTATWLSSYTGRRVDPYDVAANIRGGVTLLAVLRREASLDTTIGSYYQGLASIRAHGMYADTRAYVASVRALMRQLG